jgi:hypothetical protein
VPKITYGVWILSIMAMDGVAKDAAIDPQWTLGCRAKKIWSAWRRAERTRWGDRYSRKVQRNSYRKPGFRLSNVNDRILPSSEINSFAGTMDSGLAVFPIA